MPAQTLARPGWAGSGLATDAWWRTAVFYRIDVAHFQDSDADGVGDLQGVAQRLDYLQALGVDAVILELPFADAHFDNLLRAASAQHIRLLVALSPAGASAMPATARHWLTRGAAGVMVPSALLKSNAVAVRNLRGAVAAFPGQRVLLTLPETGTSAHAEQSRSEGADLVGLSTDIPQADTDAPFPAALRRALTEAEVAVGNSSPLLYSDNCCRTADAELFPADAARTLSMNKITATRLLASRGAAVLLYGQELGLLSPPRGGAAATMRWTPSNLTLARVEPVATAIAPQPTRPREDIYGAFVPYVAPKPLKTTAGSADATARIDLDLLPGFSAAGSSAAPTSATSFTYTTNAATEDADPNSLLNFYRRLIQLHHGNSSLRSGTPYVLDHDREQALVWVRRAPAGARTAATVIVACNLGGRPLTLSLRSDLERLHIRPGTLRPLLASWTQTPAVQATDGMQLPPYSAFIGELFHESR